MININNDQLNDISDGEISDCEIEDQENNSNSITVGCRECL